MLNYLPKKTQKIISDNISILLTKNPLPSKSKNLSNKKVEGTSFQMRYCTGLYVEYYCHSVGLNRALLVHLFLNFLED